MSTGEVASDKKRLLGLVAIAIVGAIAVALLIWQYGTSGTSDSFYDKSLENPKLPPGVMPGQQPPGPK